MMEFIYGIAFTLLAIYLIISGILLMGMIKHKVLYKGKIRWGDLIFCFTWIFYVIKYW